MYLGIKSEHLFKKKNVWVPIMMSGRELGDRDGKGAEDREALK